VYCKKKYAVKQIQESVKQMKQMGPMGEALAQPFKEIIHKLEAWTPNEAEMLEEMWQKFDENHDGKVCTRCFFHYSFTLIFYLVLFIRVSVKGVEARAPRSLGRGDETARRGPGEIDGPTWGW
jgi:hypothetical protein